MVRAAHRADLAQRGDEAPRGGPDHESERDHDEEVLDPGPEALGARDALHAEPEVVVRAQEQHADEDGLDDPEPRHEAAHHRDAHRLVVSVDLEPEPVPGERQDHQRRERHEVPDVPHPVVAGPLLVGLGAEEPEGRVGGGDRAPEDDVGDEPVDVDRHPREVVDGLPEGPRELAGVVDAGRRDHERDPGVRHEQDRRAEEVREHADRDVEPLPRPREPVPAVVPEVHGERLEEEEGGVEPHGRREDPAHEGPEPGIERDQEEEEEPPEQGRRREGREGELDELVGRASRSAAPPRGPSRSARP